MEKARLRKLLIPSTYDKMIDAFKVSKNEVKHFSIFKVLNLLDNVGK